MDTKKLVIKNISSSVVTFILNILLTFVSRTFFIKILGQEFNGLNGLFTSVIAMLSLADLGIDQALVFSLLKPLNEKNTSIISGLIRLYRKIYFLIAIIVAGIGCLLLPFLPNIVGKSDIKLSSIYLIFMLFLLNSVASYLLAYNRTLINAAQKRYIIVYNDFLFSVCKNILQIIVLIVSHNFIFYLVIALFITILSNLNLHRIVKKDYKYLDKSYHNRLPNEVTQKLKKLAVGNLSDKIGGLIVFNSDNILMSLFIGLSSVGIYSNYVLLSTIISSFSLTVLTSMTSTIGTKFINSSNEENLNVFYNVNFANFLMVYFTNIMLIVLINPFIRIWIGEKYLFSNTTLLLFFINMVLTQMRNAPIVYNMALGISWQTRWKSIIEAVVNLVLSLLFITVFKLGVNGILLGTIMSTILVVYWYEPYMLFKYRFNGTSKKFLILYFLRPIEILLVGIVLFIIFDNKFGINGLFEIVISGFILSIILICLIFMVHHREKEFTSAIKPLKKILKIKST